MTLRGYDLVAQRLLRAIFDGGCVSTCVGRCTCREELAEALRDARDEGRRIAAAPRACPEPSAAPRRA